MFEAGDAWRRGADELLPPRAGGLFGRSSRDVPSAGREPSQDPVGRRGLCESACVFGVGGTPSPANVLSLSRSRPSHDGRATRSVARNEARKRRANERPRVGCCEELAGPDLEVTNVADATCLLNVSSARGTPGRVRRALPPSHLALLAVLARQIVVDKRSEPGFRVNASHSRYTNDPCLAWSRDQRHDATVEVVMMQ
jgi:hypothetical protein